MCPSEFKVLSREGKKRLLPILSQIEIFIDKGLLECLRSNTHRPNGNHRHSQKQSGSFLS